MTGKAFIFNEFQRVGVLICNNSVISCNELSTELFTACKRTHSLMLMELRSQTYRVTAVPSGLQFQFVVMLEPFENLCVARCRHD